VNKRTVYLHHDDYGSEAAFSRAVLLWRTRGYTVWTDMSRGREPNLIHNPGFVSDGSGWQTGAMTTEGKFVPGVPYTAPVWLTSKPLSEWDTFVWALDSSVGERWYWGWDGGRFGKHGPYRRRWQARLAAWRARRHARAI
jgi:hypothetical protein